MKKILSVILCICMLLPFMSMILSVSAADTCTCGNTPVIYIKGRTNIYKTTDDTSEENKAEDNFTDTDTLIKGAANIVPLLGVALLTDDWDMFCDAVYDTVMPIYDQYRLNDDGEIDNQSGIDPDWKIENICAKMKREASWRHKTKDPTAIQFQYDMRLDPRENADDLNTYINTVIEATGHKKVSIIARCAGTLVANAYFNKYGYDKIESTVIYNAISSGAEIADELFSNKVIIDADGLNSFVSAILDTTPIMELIKEVVNLATFAGVIGTGLDAFNGIYDKVSANVTPRIIRGIFGTCPGWWGMVSPEHLEECQNFVFDGNKDGKYDKVIEKINGYNEYKKNAAGILQEMKANGVNVYIIAKYASQMYPCIDSYTVMGDGVVSVYKQSFRGVTAAPYKSQLTEEYINSRIDAGLGRYISADKALDASTAPFTDYTWYIKDLEHDWYPDVINDFAYKLVQYDGYADVTTFADRPQFMLYKDLISGNEGDNYGILEPLTEENCDFSTDTSDTSSGFAALIRFLTKFFNWLKSLFVK